MSKTLGVAFGGSGAEGIAGIAYVRALEEMGIQPDIVSGTGVGSVIAAMYAAGMTSEDMIKFLKDINFPGAKRPINENKVKDAKYGILDDMGLEEYFQIVVPVKVFDRLYFPLKIVAADYVDGSEVVFTDGSVGTAVRAGVSIPGIFSPHETEETFYIDGSCVNPVPFDTIRNDCDVLVCIDPKIIHAIDENEEESGEIELSLNVFPVFKASFDAAKSALMAEKMKSCNIEVYEKVPVNIINKYDFVQYQEILDSLKERVEDFKTKIAEAMA
jgi:NTE family protein